MHLHEHNCSGTSSASSCRKGILDFFEPVWMETQSLDSRESKKDIFGTLGEPRGDQENNLRY